MKLDKARMLAGDAIFTEKMMISNLTWREIISWDEESFFHFLYILLIPDDVLVESGAASKIEYLCALHKANDHIKWILDNGFRLILGCESPVFVQNAIIDGDTLLSNADIEEAAKTVRTLYHQNHREKTAQEINNEKIGKRLAQIHGEKPKPPKEFVSVFATMSVVLSAVGFALDDILGMNYHFAYTAWRSMLKKENYLQGWLSSILSAVNGGKPDFPKNHWTQEALKTED